MSSSNYSFGGESQKRGKYEIEEAMGNFGALNKLLIGATHYPKAEDSNNPFKKNAAKFLRKTVGYASAGNMTSKEQDTYAACYGKNPRNLTLQNAAVFGGLIQGTAYAISSLFGAEGFSEGDLQTLFTNAAMQTPSSIWAIVKNKGCAPLTPGSLIQNIASYITDPDIQEKIRGTATSQGIIPEQKSLDDILENDGGEVKNLSLPQKSYSEIPYVAKRA